MRPRRDRNEHATNVCRVAISFTAAAPLSAFASGDVGSVPAATEPLQQIVITADKRESTVQETPQSITAISGDQLIQQGLSTLEDVAARVPGVSMKQFSPGQTEYEMRGLPSSGGSYATVGLYLGEVPMAAPAFSGNGKAMIDPDLYDLQRVEILRGPQGTLYGAGSLGGTIKLIPNPPVFNRFEGSSQASTGYTDHGGFNWGVSAMLNLPLVENYLALRLVGTDKYDDGWIDRIVVNPFPLGATGTCGWPTCVRGDVQNAPVVSKTPNTNWHRLTGGRASVLFQPIESLSIEAMAFYQGLSSGAFPQVDASIGVENLDRYVPFNNGTPFNDTFRIFSLELNYDFGFARLTSESAKWNHESEWNGDASEVTEYLVNEFFRYEPFESTLYRNADHTEQASEELRFTSTRPAAFQWVIGGFYSNFTSIYDQYSAVPAYAPLSFGGATANPAGILYQAYNPYYIKQAAAFAEGSYALTRTLKATVGLRAFRYHVELDEVNAGIFGLSGNAQQSTGHAAHDASDATPRFNLSYTPDPNLTVYGQLAKGFRPGGLNPSVPLTLCSAIPTSFAPDYVWNYEVGEKARLAENRVTINADVYYIRWKNVQQLLTLPCAYEYTANIGTAASYGPELEITAQLAKDLSFSMQGSYTNAHVVDVNASLLGNTVGSTEQLAPGIPLLNVPRYQFSEALTYSPEVGADCKLSVRLEARTMGPFYDIAYYVQRLPSYTIADARIGLVGQSWAGYLFVNNLTDRVAALTINTWQWVANAPAMLTPAVTTPRTIGLEANYRF